MMTAAGFLNSAAMLRAASRSTKLLYDSSLPCSCFAAASPCDFASRGNIQRRGLMRIFSVAQFLLAAQRNVDALGEQRAIGQLDVAGRGRQSLEFGRDHAVVARSRRENFARQIDARRQRSFLRRFQFRRHARVVRGIGDDRHALEIFRRRAQHRRAADVDILDQLFRGQPALRRRRFKRIQIHHDEIDRRDAVFRRLRLIVLMSCGDRASRRAPSDAASSRARQAFPASR